MRWSNWVGSERGNRNNHIWHRNKDQPGIPVHSKKEPYHIFHF